MPNDAEQLCGIMAGAIELGHWRVNARLPVSFLCPPRLVKKRVFT